MNKIAILALLLLAPSQQVRAASIYVKYSGDDAVGQQVIYQLREAISQSSRHKIVYNEADAGFTIHLVTVENTQNISTSYSAVLTMPPFNGSGFNYYITSVAGNCGRSRVRECGQNILADFDSEINQVVEAFSNATKKPK